MVERARALGWPEDAVDVIDEDLGHSGATADDRNGFRRLAEAVAHGKAGAIFALEVSVATERLSLLPDGRLLYRLKRRWRDRTSHVIYEPLEFIGKLAALVPPPRFHAVRYYGILAPAAARRSLVVPESEEQDALPHAGCPAKSQAPAHAGKRKGKGRSRPRSYTWAELIKRVFLADVLVCDRCGGRMKVLCAVHPPAAILKILTCLGLPSRPPPIAQAAPAFDDPYIS
jgi:hypothetical protein